jgi:prophage regulatory protein
MIYRLISEGKIPAPYKLSPLASRLPPPASRLPPPASRWSDREIATYINDVKDGFEGKKRNL